MKKILFYWLPVTVWMVFINPLNEGLTAQNTSRFIVPFLMWLMPNASSETISLYHAVIRKIAHFLEYAFLVFLLFRAFRAEQKGWRTGWALGAGIIALGYAALDEFLQSMIAARTGSPYDWLIDCAGVLCALGILSVRKGEPINSS
ncbi:MAG: VanZ family protein [Thermodesulfovibrionales bacterium]|nr:VanZ family protein [Thermodesulfovibrionales bacterium]